MTKFLVFFFLQLLVLCATMYLILTYAPKEQGRIYNCTWVEISPDIPPKVKEECRKQNAKKIV
jgi:hypothetical protein